ncbi:MAG: conjugal transfer protein TraF [Elusimicrobiota bacterium]
MIKRILILSIALSINGSVFAGIFEHLGGGVRAAGMGNAAVAVVDDASAVYWNPAGLMNLKYNEFSASRADLYGLGLVSYDNYFYGHPGMGIGSVGFGIMRLATTSKVDFLDFSENTFIFSFGTKPQLDFLRNLSLGANVKYYKAQQKTTGTGYGIDAGAQYRYRDFYAGAAVQDMNWPEIHFQSDSDDIIPANLILGAGYKHGRLFTLAFDWDNFQEGNTQFHAGAEAWFAGRIIAVRLGAIRQHLALWTYTMGLGIRVSGLQFDYAMKKHFDLDNTHLFSMTLRL